MNNLNELILNLGGSSWKQEKLESYLGAVVNRKVTISESKEADEQVKGIYNDL